MSGVVMWTSSTWNCFTLKLDAKSSLSILRAKITTSGNSNVHTSDYHITGPFLILIGTIKHDWRDMTEMTGYIDAPESNQTDHSGQNLGKSNRKIKYLIGQVSMEVYLNHDLRSPPALTSSPSP